MSAENPKILLDCTGNPIDGVGGFETEFGLKCKVKENSNLDDDVTGEVAFVANGRGTNQYKEDGDREYLDVGHHPEISTAEDTNFLDSAHRVVYSFVKAQRKHQKSAVAVTEKMEAERRPIVVEVSLVANTCDPHGNTWASHNNVMAPRGLRFEDYYPALLVHNVSHIVWSGAGHVQPKADGEYNYCLSERADHFWDLFSDATTRCRPLVNTRDVPYADAQRFRRIHDITGDAVMSPHVYALRRASVAILLRACGLGVKFDDLIPENPLAAIRLINHDPTLKTKVSMAKGGEMSALDMQRYAIERSLATNGLTEQEELWGRKWQTLLDDLAKDPQLAERRVNWIVKDKLIQRELEAKRNQINSKGSDRLSPGAVALQKSINFHRLLPTEGEGLKLLRKGFFEDSPSADILENGVPLPETRARVRGEAIGRILNLPLTADRYDQIFGADWDVLTLYPITNARTQMSDPFRTDMPASLERNLERLGV